MAALVASQVSCVKRDIQLFSQLDISVQPGQVWHVKGHNGSGKTSLLRMLAGLSPPHTGTIFWQQAPLTAAYARQLIFLGHKNGLSQALSALHNLLHWCRQHGVPFCAEHTHQVLAYLGLAGREHIPTRQLSAGQQQRVALARLWLKPATVWILDEPFTALDSAGIAAMEQHCRQFVAQGGAIVLTSHQPLGAVLENVQVLELGAPT